MKTKLFIIMSLIVITCGCIDVCHLTRDDKDWILEEYKSLNYMENDTKTIKVDIDNHFDTSYGKEGWWPTGEGLEWGKSTIYIHDSLYMIQIFSTACQNKNGVFLDHKIFSKLNKGFFYYKDSLTNNTVTVLGKEYKNCFVFKDSIYNIQNLTFVKNYGIVKIEFNDGYKLELIP